MRSHRPTASDSVAVSWRKLLIYVASEKKAFIRNNMKQATQLGYLLSSSDKSKEYGKRPL